MIAAPRSLSVPNGTRVSVQLVFDGAATEERIAAASVALAAWAGGNQLTLPPGVRVLSAMPADDAFAAPTIPTDSRVEPRASERTP